MFLVPSVLIFPIWTEINFIQASRIVNFTKAIGNQCFIFHNMCFSIQIQLTQLENCVQL